MSRSAYSLGPVHLIVRDLEKLLPWYQSHLGFSVHWHEGGKAGLGAGGDDLLVLEQNPEAVRDARAANIYHVAISVPDRLELARMVARLFSRQWQNSPTDHLESEVTYLDDPEGNTIELVHTTPERGKIVFPDDGSRPYAEGLDGRRHAVSEALDVRALLGELPPDVDLDAAFPAAAAVHHVHLYASSLASMDQFYRETLGFPKHGYSERIGMADYAPPGYAVHMVAFNNWKGEGIPAKARETAGLKYFTVYPPDLEAVRDRLKGFEVEEVDGGLLVHDPSGLGVLLKA